MDQIYNFIEQEDGDVRPCVLHVAFGIPESSARRFLACWKQDKSYRNYDYTKRGAHQRIFTDEEERSIAEFIRANILEQGLYFTDEDFRYWVMQAFLEKHQDDEQIKQFNASNGFIYNFKQRNGSQVAAHISSAAQAPLRQGSRLGSRKLRN